MKELFDMTRRERRGTIVVLALIALILAVTLITRQWRNEPPVTPQQEEMLRFDAATDSLAPPQAVHRGKPHSRHHATKKKSPEKSGKNSGKKSGKKSPTSAPMDPVPQF